MAVELPSQRATVATPGDMIARRSLSRYGWTLFFAVPLALLVIVAVIAPLLPLPDPAAQDLRSTLIPPVFMTGGTWEHPLGTDALGRDMLSRLIYGSRRSLSIAVGALLLSTTFGTFVGILSGYRRGWVERIVLRVIDAQLAIPYVLLAMAITVSFGRSLLVLIVVLALVGWAIDARVIRSQVVELRERPFVMGLQVAGCSRRRIMLFHILPNVFNTALVLATFNIGNMILIESALSFLGVGLVPPHFSWGTMLASGRSHIATAWWLVAFPGLAITIVVLLTNLIGDALRTLYDPRKRRW